MNPSVTIRIGGIAQAVASVKDLSDRARGRMLLNAAIAGGFVIERRWKELFRAASEPSVAGLPPRVKTGTYRRSVHTAPGEVTADSATAVVGTSLSSPPYPVYLEYGTSRMPAHPIARPASEQGAEEAAKAIANAVVDQLVP